MQWATFFYPIKREKERPAEKLLKKYVVKMS